MNPGFIVRLRPAGPWRIGPASGARNGVDDIYHSDSLYSAITAAIAQIDWIEEWLMATADSGESGPMVRFTSCFPYQRDILFVPPPRTLWPPHGSGKVRWQGARFVPLSVVERLLSGSPLDEDRWIVDGATGCVLPSDRPHAGPFRTALRGAAAVDRLTGESIAHTTACLEFAGDSGLWCAISFAGDEAKERWAGPLQGAFRLLADSGFGGERSRGWGRAETPLFTEGTLPELILPPATASNGSEEHAWWLLSVFSPSSGDPVDWSRGNYAVMTRAGRIESTAAWGVPKLTGRVLCEGSVVISPAEPRGAAPNVAPDGFPHPVYRYGHAVFIPIAARGGTA
jgi:CRISPR type III-A-associated RAMP protein Csm4